MQVVVVCGVRLYREGLAQVLQEDGRLQVVGMAAQADVAVEMVQEPPPDAVLIDTALPGVLDAVATMVKQVPQTKVLALGLSESHSDILALAEAGVAGYVRREGSLEDLIEAVQSAVRDELRCSRRIAAALLHRVSMLARRPDPGLRPVRLTAREREVTALLEEGLTNKEIGSRLIIEVATVKNHVHNILEKLDAHSRGEAVAKVRALGVGPHPSFGLLPAGPRPLQ